MQNDTYTDSTQGIFTDLTVIALAITVFILLIVILVNRQTKRRLKGRIEEKNNKILKLEEKNPSAMYDINLHKSIDKMYSSTQYGFWFWSLCLGIALFVGIVLLYFTTKDKNVNETTFVAGFMTLINGIAIYMARNTYKSIKANMESIQQNEKWAILVRATNEIEDSTKRDEIKIANLDYFKNGFKVDNTNQVLNDDSQTVDTTHDDTNNK